MKATVKRFLKRLCNIEPPLNNLSNELLWDLLT